MELFEAAILTSALLCALVAGPLFAFAIVVMPGLRTLGNADFIRAFQAIDLVIPRNQPLFMLVWIGSVVALLVASVLGFGRLEGARLLLLVAAAAAYVLGVQLPTAVINVPLNNRLQEVDVTALDAAEIQAARETFEPRWNRWNAVRTVVAALAVLLLLILLLAL